MERAEKNDTEGNRIYKDLKTEYLEKYMPKPDADPHGGLEDFEKLDDPICSTPSIRPKSVADEMH